VEQETKIGLRLGWIFRWVYPLGCFEDICLLPGCLNSDWQLSALVVCHIDDAENEINGMWMWNIFSLFPTMPRHNLVKVAPMVREFCKKHELDYQIKPAWTAFADIVR